MRTVHIWKRAASQIVNKEICSSIFTTDWLPSLSPRLLRDESMCYLESSIAKVGLGTSSSPSMLTERTAEGSPHQLISSTPFDGCEAGWAAVVLPLDP